MQSIPIHLSELAILRILSPTLKNSPSWHYITRHKMILLYKSFNWPICVGRHIGHRCCLLPLKWLGIVEIPLPERFLHVGCQHSLVRVHTDQSFNHVPRFLGDVLVDVLKLAFFYLLEEVCLALGSEWIVTLQNNK